MRRGRGSWRSSLEYGLASVAAPFPGLEGLSLEVLSLEVLGGKEGDVKPLVNMSSPNGHNMLEEGVEDACISRSSQGFLLLFGVPEEGRLEASSSSVCSSWFSQREGVVNRMEKRDKCFATAPQEAREAPWGRRWASVRS